MGSSIDEELERALKLSLNPEEQMTKEQRDFVLACKESLLESKEPPDLAGTNKALPLNIKQVNMDISPNFTDNKDDEEVIYLDDTIDELYDRLPMEGGLSDIIHSHGDRRVEKMGEEETVPN